MKSRDKLEYAEIETAHLFAWVKAGLLRYQQQNLTDKTDEISYQEQQIAFVLTGYADMEWNEINQILLTTLNSSNNGPARLIKNTDMSLAELFLFTLCSAIESDRAVVLRIAEIQQSNKAGWLQYGVAVEIIQFLFSLSAAPDLTQYQLVRQEILIIKGQGPLVSRPIYTSSDYWKAVCEDNLLPEVFSIADIGIVHDESLIKQISELVLHKKLLALETDLKTAEALTLALSQQAGLQPVYMNFIDWQQTSLSALIRYAGWLPLVNCTQFNDPLTVSSEPFTPGILMVRSDQQLPDNCLRIDLKLADSETRRKWWSEWINDEESLTALTSSLLNQAAVNRVGQQLLNPLDGAVLHKVKNIRSSDGTTHLKKVAMPVDTWVDEEMLIFPEETHNSLEKCFKRTLQRNYQQLGMGNSIQATANAGVMLLFSGASGTGKTLASSWLSCRLGAPLFKIDLAMIMNKYVGETEKNLALALDEAAKSDVVLLFDEADALFGKRSDSSHGGDRYANMLTNYLLSRIETHPGIVILTTNAGSRMDSSFQRRIDIAVEFQAMSYEERIRLWEAMLATRNPGKSLCQRLARYCELPPGHVRNVVINACCWYPEQLPLTAYAIWQGLEEEYRKVGRSMPSQLMALKELGLTEQPSDKE